MSSSGGNNPSLDDLRQMGNHHFAEGNYDSAVQLYTMAIDKAANDEDALILNLCNRSTCLFKMERYEDAHDDALQAFQTSQGKSVKACYRLAKTLIALKKYDQAGNTVQAVLDALDESVTKQQRKAFEDLLHEAQHDPEPETLESIKTVKRPVSIREFKKGRELGYGNFSEIVVATCRETEETFALKIIDKKKAADLAKRQHPNVYNEIQMERRVLLERLPPHPYIVKMYHAFQDYNSIYYLMDLHVEWGDLWSTIRFENKMVGCHRSLTKVYLSELIDAIEHMHTHGIVHRDLKPENVLLNGGHVLVVDFGTAKDLIQQDLNGPEFVGTPDFMSPEAVKGPSEEAEIQAARERGDFGADHRADLWALGAVAFHLHTGQTPFWSPSPYLTFLKIKRGNLLRPWGIADDDAWDFIRNLMQEDPSKRLGAECFSYDGTTITKSDGGYDLLRSHAYFTCRSEGGDAPLAVDAKESTPIASLQDLCIRACSDLARRDALDVEVCDRHPPGDGSSHDMLRLSPRNRLCVMHLLDRLGVLNDPTVFRRFFASYDYRLDKIRQGARDFVGLTRMNDNQYQFPLTPQEKNPHAKPAPIDPIKIVFLTSPLLVESINESCDEKERKKYMKLLKKSIATINRSRPNMVVVSGFIDDKCRKFLARVSESIPVVLIDGSTYFTFWQSGVQGLAIRSSDWASTPVNEEHLHWLRDELEQNRMAKQHLFVFVDCDPRELPDALTKRLVRAGALAVMGPSEKDTFDTNIFYDYRDDDNASVRSTDSVEDEDDNRTTRLLGTLQNGLELIIIEEREEWKLEFMPIELPSSD
jgi:3-phosphoinositide dependent protein kinase-1